MTHSHEKEISAAKHELEKFGYRQQLKRALTRMELIAFGLNYMIPIAPAIIFGFILKESGGTVALPYLLAGLGMSFTALSYGILIQKFPMAGSLYTYVSRGWNARIGFLAGWILLLDYLLIPTVTSMSSVIYIQEFFPHISYGLLLFLFVSTTGLINLFGVNLMAKLGLWLLVIGEIVIFVGFAVWSYAVGINGIGTGHLISLEPFHFSSLSALASATSIAVLSYLGFDAITTLAEEANNPKRDIPIAIFWSVMIGGFTMFLTGYLGVLVVPNWRDYIQDPDWLNATLFHIAKITGGEWFTIFYTSGFLLAMAVFNVVATAAGARLLFGMGRDNVLPKKIFSAVNKRWQTPHWNIVIITFLEFLIGILFTVDNVTELVNYGALLGFILLNLTVIWFYYIKKKDNEVQLFHFSSLLKFLLFPLLGIILLSWIFVNMQKITLLVGTLWLVGGIFYSYFFKDKAISTFLRK